MDNLIYNVLTCYNTGEDTQSMSVIHPFDIKAFIPTKHRKILLLTSVRVSKEGHNPFKVLWIVIEMVRFTVRFWTCTDLLILKIALNSQTRQWISLIIIRKSCKNLTVIYLLHIAYLNWEKTESRSSVLNSVGKS